MKQCVKCNGALSATEVREEVRVAGATFAGLVRARRCDGCGEVYIAAEDAMRFDLRVARELGIRGAATGEAFKFMRKALAMRAADLAGLLGVAAETVSRWERGERSVDRAALTVVGALVVDKLEGRATTMKLLKAQQAPQAVEGLQLAVGQK
ncbi:MAG: helix-turn-helix domain-containing protein [Myxococcales bacterium]|nr:helix-turn-helix domain-containing protein [Myxococcales bacterium]